VEARVTTEEERRLEEYVAAARREQAPGHLRSQILGHLAYRDRLAQRGSVRHWRSWVSFGAVAAALAAGWFLGRFSQQPPPITAERPAGGGAASASPAGAARALVNPCQNRRSAAGKSPLLDDFEDGDDAVAALEGREGFWRWARETDFPGTAPALIPVPRGDGLPHNRLAVHVKGSQLNDWGATVELDFRPRCYDAARYAGLTFEARGPGRVYLAAREVQVIPVAEGGTCERDCHNPHVTKVELTDGFRTYRVRWSELRQRGIDRPPLDAGRLHSIAFLIRPEDTPYDVWVDDVSFLPAQ
jgi:hypothetical protein